MTRKTKTVCSHFGFKARGAPMEKVRYGFALKCVSRFWLCRTCCWCWRQVQLRWWPPTDGCHYSLPSSSVLLLQIFPQIENWEQFCAEAQSVKIIFGCFRPAIYVLYVIHLQFLFLVVLAVLWFQSQLTLLWNPGPKRPWVNATRQDEEGPDFQVSFGNHKFKAKFRQDLDVKGSTGQEREGLRCRSLL